MVYIEYTMMRKMWFPYADTPSIGFPFHSVQRRLDLLMKPDAGTRAIAYFWVGVWCCVEYFSMALPGPFPLGGCPWPLAGSALILALIELLCFGRRSSSGLMADAETCPAATDWRQRGCIACMALLTALSCLFAWVLTVQGCWYGLAYPFIKAALLLHLYRTLYPRPAQR